MFCVIIIVDSDPSNLDTLWRLVASVLISQRQHSKGVNMIHSIITALTTMQNPRNQFYKVIEL